MIPVHVDARDEEDLKPDLSWVNLPEVPESFYDLFDGEARCWPVNLLEYLLVDGAEGGEHHVRGKDLVLHIAVPEEASIGEDCQGIGRKPGFYKPDHPSEGERQCGFT
ncbi:MAG: hypothetical protein A4E40_01013 [Methanoregulaceae archaeon PtaU1.Bin059]|nr:MAG: hypothetical protein A4E40_01013 [Methanoregulaceae archaeon PtaU1.Bin059]